MNYDYIIVGGGPNGLCLATLLPGKILLIEKESTLGGCHRVKRVDQMFTEHGPRIYSTSYINTISLLQSINLDWNNYFTKYDFQFLSIGLSEILSSLSIKESIAFVNIFIQFCFGFVDFKISIGQWMNENGFSETSQDFIDRLCRMTDGSDKTRYLLSSFLNIINQNFFYSFQQPSKPMDLGLIKDWEEKIIQKGVTISTGEIVETVSPHKINTNKRSITANKIIFAMPPQYLVEIIKRSEWNPFPASLPIKSDWLETYAAKTAYIKYISLTFHFKDVLTLDHIWGLTKDSKWGIVFIKLSDYQQVEKGYKTVFTIAITKINSLGENGKTANDCSEEEIKEEVFTEMNQLFHFPVRPDHILIYHGDDKAFVVTKEGYKNFQNEEDGIYTCSTHIGKSPYVFTSMESAVTNAIWLYNKLTGANRPIKTLWTIDIFVVLIILLIFGLLAFYVNKTIQYVITK